MSRLLQRLILLPALVAAMVGPAGAQNFPVKPVRIVVAFAPGGPIDLLARPVSQKLTELLGQSFVIDYKTGANGIIGADFVAKSAPDGYNLVIFSPAHTTNPSTQKSLPYDTLKDFVGVSPIGRTDLALVGHPALPIRSVRDMVAFAKAKPGQLNFASSGSGGSPHLGLELLKMTAGVNITHVPYKGAGPALQDVLAGTADLTFASLPAALGMIKAGKLRLIGVASPKRATGFPDVPTIEEQGFPKFHVISAFGLLAPGATPKPVVARLNGAMEKALSSTDIRQSFANMGLEPWYLTSEDLQAWLAEEVEKWQKVTRAINFQPE